MSKRRSKMENPNNATCQDCGAEVWVFMVHDSLWAEAGLNKGHFCRACVAKRLGRPLVNGDFTDCPANWYNVPGCEYSHNPGR